MADDPGEAGTPRTKDVTRVYDEGRIRVHWDATLCHTAVCLQRLRQVFDVKARRWVDVTGAPPEGIAATIRACPTGALRYDGPGVAIRDARRADHDRGPPQRSPLRARLSAGARPRRAARRRAIPDGVVPMRCQREQALLRR